MGEAYKWLSPDHTGSYGHGNYTSHLPRGKRPGKWTPTETPKQCASGWHVTDLEHLWDHWQIGGMLYIAECRGASSVSLEKTAWGSIRLVRPLGVLTPEIARTFACDVAERVLSVYEQAFPDDDRPRKAIETARSGDNADHAAAETARSGDNAARAAARIAAVAADSAANSAANSAPNAASPASASAAYAAAYAAASAAYAAAVAAYSAANAAYSAANAAHSAVNAANAAAANDAAYADFRSWAGNHLIELLSGDVTSSPS